MNAVLAAALADFRQRVRSFRFVAVLMATIGLCLLMLPAQDANYVVLDLGHARGVYGSAWVGLVFGVIGSTTLPLFGFFIVKDAIARDRDTRVGLLLAASPLGRFAYLGAKMLSNVAIFVVIMAAATLVAFAMQWWRGEDRVFHPLDLLLHLWLVPLPVLLATAAMAVLFECVPGLRGAFGNVVFFFVWVTALSTGLSGVQEGDHDVVRRADFFGISAPLADFQGYVNRALPGHEGGLSIGADIGARPPTPIPWPGIGGDGAWIAQRFAWSLLCLPMLLLAALGFDRFDPARWQRRTEKPAKADRGEDVAASTPSRWHALTPLPAFAGQWRVFAMLRAELALLLKRRAWWWYAVVAGLWIAALGNTPANAVQWVVPLAWLFGITGFSQHGARMEIHGTRALLASAPAPLLRQLPLQWLAGALFALALVAPLLVKLAMTGAPGVAWQIVVGAGFVSALALALGALSGGARLFELVFLMLWYVALQKTPGLGFMGRFDASVAASDAPLYLALCAALLALALGLRGLALRR